MARIAGIDLPREKRIEIGLTYIYGIGRTSAKEILEKAGIDPDIRVKNLTEDQEAALREVIDHHYTIEGDLRREGCNEYQAAHRDWLLPRCAASPRPACPRPADQDQRPHPEGPEEDHCQ